MNSARHEGILAKSESYLHLIAVAPSDESVEEMVSLLKAEPGEDYDKKPTASEPAQDLCIGSDAARPGRDTSLGHSFDFECRPVFQSRH